MRCRGSPAACPTGPFVLDAGAGEGQYRGWFARQRYVGLDLGIGDSDWNYRGLDAIADLRQLPLRSGGVDAALNIVTLEHVTDPGCVLAELWRALRPGGRLLLVVPHEWEEHQQPHDFYRYTRYGIEHLLAKGGIRSDGHPAGRRLLPAAVAAFAERTAVLSWSVRWFPPPSC